MATTTTRLLDNYVNGAWVPAAERDRALDVTNPATGEVLARVPLSGAETLTQRSAPPAQALPAWRAVSTIERARTAVRASRAPGGAPGGPRPRRHLRDGQDDRRRPRRGRPHDRDGRGRLRDPDDDAGPRARGRLAQHRRRDLPPAGRRLRGDRAVQLPRDGAVLVPPVRDRLRQHLRAEALRAGAADPADRVRGARRARPAAGRRQPRQRRPGDRRGDPRSPGDRRGVIRRLGAGCQARLRARREGRQARPGARWCEEPHGRDARRGDLQDGRRDRSPRRSAPPASVAWRDRWSSPSATRTSS